MATDKLIITVKGFENRNELSRFEFNAVVGQLSRVEMV